MDIIGFKERPKYETPTAIGIYDRETGTQKKTCTLEMRIFRPGYIMEGILLSTLKKRRPRSHGKLDKLKALIDSQFETSVNNYLKPFLDVNVLLSKQEFSLLPRLSSNYKEYEVETLLDQTVVDQSGDITPTGKKIIEASKLALNYALDPFLEFERLCLLKGIAERIGNLTEILNLTSKSQSADVLNATLTPHGKSFQIQTIKPIINSFYLVNLEENPALYSTPSPDSVVFLSNLAISEYYRFHYSLRKQIYLGFLKEKGLSVEHSALHRFAGRIGAIDLLKNLSAYKVEEGYRFFRFPTNLLRSLAHYELSFSKKRSFSSFLATLRDDFRIIVRPSDLKDLYPFRLATNQIDGFFENNYAMFVDRLLHAGVVSLKPDGEVEIVG